MHLLYARFFTKVLYDLGLINFDEPFTKLVHQGMITNNGAKMSKSRGNVVNPDEFVNKYGSDTFRMYMMFMGSYEEGGNWNDEGITGIYRFIGRVWRLLHILLEAKPCGSESERFSAVLRQQHYAVKHCTQSLERFHFNTAISRIMELVNEIYLYIQDVPAERQNTRLVSETMPILIQILAPFCPHIAEELWQLMNKPYSIFNTVWPTYDETMLILEKINLGVQINGKIRGQIQVDANAQDEEVLSIARNAMIKYLEGKKINKAIVVPKKLVVFAVSEA